MRVRFAGPTLALVFVLAGCSSASRSVESPPTTPAADAEAQAELEALYWERRAEARTSFTEADVRFMAGMIGHHAQALIMSRLAPANGASPSVQTLAARIINAQRDEITSMQTWLRDREQPVPEVHIEGLRLMIHGGGAHAHHDHTTMPGMLSQAQLEELAAARGADFDRLFLAYMIQHHSGAVTMVEDLFSHDGAGQDEAAFKIASDINVDQITEIARMQQMLDGLAADTP
ncbi:MAG: DUF305 domain-containing protein [Rhodothermales bacterium]